jgi:hypothetical protein
VRARRAERTLCSRPPGERPTPLSTCAPRRLNSKVRLLREELSLLQEPGSYVGEIVAIMGRQKVLVKVHPEGKYVVDIDKTIDITKLNVNDRVALRNDSYTLHLVLPSKVDPVRHHRVQRSHRAARSPTRGPQPSRRLCGVRARRSSSRS